MPATNCTTGFLVNLVNVLVEVTGIGVANTWLGRGKVGAAVLKGFKPVASSAAAGNVPSVLKFSAEANISVSGDSELS